MIENNVTVELYDSDGTLVHREEGHNVVTTAGKQWILDQLVLTSSARIRYIAFGTASTNFTTASTALTAEFGRASLSQPTFHSTYGSCSFVHSISAGAGSTWDDKRYNEAGLFITSSGAPMYAAYSMSAVTKSSEQFLVFRWDLRWNP